MRLSNTSVEGKQFISACHLYIIYFISFNITSLRFNVNVTCIDWYRTCIFPKTHRYKLHIAYCIWNYLYVTNYYCFFQLVQMELLVRNANSRAGTVMVTVHAIMLTEVARVGVHQDGLGLYATKVSVSLNYCIILLIM